MIDICAFTSFDLEMDNIFDTNNVRFRYFIDNGASFIRWYINNERCFNNKSFQKAANLSDEDMIAIVLKYGNVT
jgi:hypothetical protein